ncbi:MAG: hypothetical protein R2851_05105 [Caldilineaceae bacterium]
MRSGASSPAVVLAMIALVGQDEPLVPVTCRPWSAMWSTGTSRQLPGGTRQEAHAVRR